MNTDQCLAGISSQIFLKFQLLNVQMIITDREHWRSRTKWEGIDGNIDLGAENSKDIHRKHKNEERTKGSIVLLN